MDPSDILKALAKERLPNELTKMIFEYVASDNYLLATVMIGRDSFCTNTRPLAEHILDHSPMLNDNLVNIMEEVLLESQDIWLDISDNSDLSSLSILDPSQLPHVRNLSLVVPVRLWVLASRVRPSLSNLARVGMALRRIVRMARKYLPGLKSFRLVLDYRFDGIFLISKAAQVAILMDSLREVNNYVLSSLHVLAHRTQCKIQIRMNHGGFEREGRDVVYQQDGHHTLASAIAQFDNAYMHQHGRTPARIGQFSSDMKAQLRNLKLICYEADPSAPIWDLDCNRKDCHLFTYVGAFQKAMYLAPAYIRYISGEHCTQPRPRLRQHTRDEIEARFLAAGGYVAPRPGPMSKPWQIELEKLCLLILARRLRFEPTADLFSQLWWTRA